MYFTAYSKFDILKASTSFILMLTLGDLIKNPIYSFTQRIGLNAIRGRSITDFISITLGFLGHNMVTQGWRGALRNAVLGLLAVTTAVMVFNASFEVQFLSWLSVVNFSAYGLSSLPTTILHICFTLLPSNSDFIKSFSQFLAITFAFILPVFISIKQQADNAELDWYSSVENQV